MAVLTQCRAVGGNQAMSQGLEFSVADGEAAASDFAWSPDGRNFAVFSEVLRRVSVFDAATGRVIGRLKELTGGVGSVAYDAMGRVICASLGEADSAFTIWDIERDATRSVPGAAGEEGGPALNSLSEFAVDRRSNRLIGISQVATGSGTRFGLSLYDLNNGTLIRKDGPATLKVALAPGGDKAAYVDPAGTVHLLDLSSGSILRSFAAEVGILGLLAFSPDARILATTGDPPEAPGETPPLNSVLRLWDVASGAKVGQISAAAGEIRSLDFSPRADRPRLALGETRGAVELFDWANGASQTDVIPYVPPQMAIARVSPDGGRVGLLLTRESVMRVVAIDRLPRD